MYFIEKDTSKAWYGPLNGVQGALASFDFAYVVPQGGNLVDLGTMTIDSGFGIDDLFLAFFEYGTVLVYSGIDPAATDDTGFRLVGQFNMGALVGARPLVNVGGDLVAHTVDGFIAMSKLLQHGRSGQLELSISDAIQPSVRDAARQFGDTSGWGGILHPPESWLLFNVPSPGGEQFVMNTQTGAWCRFTGMDARAWGRFDDKLYFGGPGGEVFLASSGASDDATNIEGDVQTAGLFVFQDCPRQANNDDTRHCGVGR